MSDRRLLWTIVINAGLTVVEVVVGLAAGSLALVADGVHNLGDAGALVIAYAARRIARRGADKRYTFGYRRAELIGAMINLSMLLVLGAYLVFEAVERLVSPAPMQTGWVMAAAGLALVVDLATAALLWAMGRGSLNLRAAFLHNLTDAAGSVAVLLGAGAVALWGWTAVDPLVTLLLAALILWSALSLLRKTARILMEAAPPGLSMDEVAAALSADHDVVDVHHLHAWELDEQHTALEAHVTLSDSVLMCHVAEIKVRLKALLADRYGIEHSTLEFETETEDCPPGHLC
ncbi:cation diffusion facilitator family transporter [Haliangium sp.]|uniref:cation diffusion facilitator family transporter n=1 Tax=Haliangium sp. TaxID=2663208 RepID=UPI003D0BAC18